MILNKNSWHVKLANFFDSDPTEEQNFCKYFWLTLLRIIVFPIVLFFSFPFSIYEYYTKKDLNISIVEKVWYGIAIDLCLLVGIAITDSLWGIFLIPGVGLIIILIIVLWLVYEEWQMKRPRKEYTYKEPKPNFFVEGFKAFYGKYCPKIDWK